MLHKVNKIKQKQTLIVNELTKCKWFNKILSFRTNGAIINGFEDNVGSRTSFYTFSTNTFRNSLRNYRGVGYRSAPQSKVRDSPTLSIL